MLAGLMLLAARGADAQIALTATAVSGTQINLSWNPTGEGVTVYRNSAFVASLPAFSTTYSDGGRANGTTYSYVVQVGYYDTDTGWSWQASNTASATTFSLPAAPSGLSATAVSGTQINLSWTDTSNNETGFKIERKPAGGTYSQITTTAANATSYSNSGLTAGTTYHYRIRSTNSVGNSAYTAEVIVTAPLPPNVPTGLGGVPVSSTQINLTWTDASNNETGFKLERKTGAGGTYSQIATPSANATTYSNTGVSSGQVYYYRLRATNAGGDSAYSAETSVSFVVPSAPAGLAATDLASGAARLSWTDTSSSETGFKLERKTGAGGTYAQVATPAANATSHDDSGLTPGVLYYYRLRAGGIPGDSAYSNEVAFTATAVNATSATLTYTYDALGNLIQVGSPGTELEFAL